MSNEFFLFVKRSCFLEQLTKQTEIDSRNPTVIHWANLQFPKTGTDPTRIRSRPRVRRRQRRRRGLQRSALDLSEKIRLNFNHGREMFVYQSLLCHCTTISTYFRIWMRDCLQVRTFFSFLSKNIVRRNYTIPSLFEVNTFFFFFFDRDILDRK